MLKPAVALTLLMLAAGASGPVSAAPKAAVFDMEFSDTSLEGQMNGRAEAETRRLDLLTARLREALDASGRYEVVDIAPVRAAALGANLQACGNCADRLARQIGAELAITGVVQKVSNLILNINLYVRDADSGKLVEGYSADIRSNTDDSWLRGLNWLLKNRLLREKTSP